MSWYGAVQKFNKDLKQNREARLSKRKIKDPAKVELGRIPLNLKKEALTEEQRNAIQQKLRRERNKTRLKVGLIYIFTIMLLLFVIYMLIKG